MEILLVLTVGTLCIVCFFVGAKVGQTVSKGERIETPELNPVKVYKEHQERKAAEEAHNEEQRRIDTIMRNIESYDGTTKGQEDVE
jgi:hypothetical protein